MLNRLTSPQDPIALFKMQSCAMLERNTAPPGGTKKWFSLRENDISRIDPFAVMFTMSINIYKSHGIIVNGSRATQNGVPAYGATAFSLNKNNICEVLSLTPRRDPFFIVKTLIFQSC